MQNIQSPLGNNIHPLGVISFFSNPEKMILRKASHSLHSQSNLISTIQTKPPLVTSSKFFLSHQYDRSIQPLIGWDSWDTEDISSEFPLIDFDASNSIAALENSNESVKNSIPEIMPTPTEVNTSNGISQEVNIKSKSKSKKTNKSQQPPERKSTSKSKAKKPSKSSPAKDVKQFVDKNNASINTKKDKSLTSNESLTLETNLETPNLQLDIASDISAKEHSYVTNITADTSPSFQNQSNLFRNITNDDLPVNSELISSLPNTDLSLTENNFTSQENIELENDTSELANSSYIELPSENNIEEIFVPDSNFTNAEKQLIPKISESVNWSGMPVSETPSQQDIEIEQVSSIIDNKNSVSQTNLIQAKEILPTLNSSSQEAESLNTNTDSEAITAIEPDLISAKITNDFVINNAVSDNSLTFSSALPSSEVDDAATLLNSFENDEKLHPLVGGVFRHWEEPLMPNAQCPAPQVAGGATSSTSHKGMEFPAAFDENPVEADVTLPNSESSIAKNSITVQQKIASDFLHHLEKTTQDITPQPPLLPEKGENLKPLPLQRRGFLDSVKSQEIDSSITSESLDSVPVELTPTSAEIEDIPTLFGNSDSNEQLVISESQSVMMVNVSNVSANVASLQRDSNVENTTSEFTESQPILAAPEIVETPTVSAISPEISEIPTITATSPEISEIPAITTILPKIVESPTISATSPEINEALVVSASSPEISEAPAITTILPKIVESPTISATSPEINEALVVSASSPEISEAPAITTILPEIVETPTVTAISPEIGEASTITATSPEVVEEASIFRKIIDNKQTVESDNPEISTFVDTWDNPSVLENPTSLQDEVSTAPKVEQNFPAPKGYATGGHVTDSHVENRQHIAPSDTVPAMLTPGEFVINTRDAQKNLPLLHHINTGGTPHNIILPSLQTFNPTEPEETISPETPTKVDSFSDTSLQLKSTETDSPEISNSLIPSSLGLNISQNKLSVLNSPQLNPLQNETIDVNETSPQYSSPPLIFRKVNPTTNTSSQWSNTPSQWSSVEDLLNGNNDEFTSFNFNDGESNNQNYEFSQFSESPQVFAKHLPAPRGFANGGEVTLPDISREIQPVTETIDNTSLSSGEGKKDDTGDLEALAREIYNRLRQRIEIERERHGGYSGRLPW